MAKLSATAIEFLETANSRRNGTYEIHRDNLKMLRTGDALEKKGFVTKNADENARFSYEYIITDAGRAAIAPASDVIEETPTAVTAEPAPVVADETPAFKVGDKALWKGNIPVVIADARDYMPDKRIVRMDVLIERTQQNDYQWDVRVSDLSPYTDPRDARIAELEASDLKQERTDPRDAQLADALKMIEDLKRRLQAYIDDYGLPFEEDNANYNAEIQRGLGGR